MVAQNMLRTYEVKSDLMTLSNKPNALYKSKDLIYSQLCASCAELPSGKSTMKL